MSTKRYQNKNFWDNFGKEYFDLTHLHGFKELSLSTSIVEKLFWIFIIIGAFTFTGYLIFQSVKDSLNEKKQTFVNYTKYGDIQLPILYCPSSWIDMERVVEANISTRYLFYSLSFLRTTKTKQTYLDEDEINVDYSVNIQPEKFCSNNSFNTSEELPELIILAPFLLHKCIIPSLESPGIPDYFGEESRYLMSAYSYRIISILFMNNVHLMKRLFDACQGNNSDVDEMWKIIYFETYLSLSVFDYVRENFFKEDFSNSRFMATCLNKTYAISITLNDLDNMDNITLSGCNKESESKSNDSKSKEPIDLCAIYNEVITYYMFYGEAIKLFLDHSCLQKTAHCELSIYRSKRIAQIISLYPNYSNYLAQNHQVNSEHTLKKYISFHFGKSAVTENAELLRIRKWSQEQFDMEERDDFYRYLRDKNLSIFDFFKTISVQESKFLLGMSIDSQFEIRPRNGTITIEKVINAYGVCYLFEVKANMGPVIELPYVMNDISNRRRINQKLYVNIMELKGNKINVRDNDNILVIGNEAKDLVPSQNWFNVKPSDNWENHYHSFLVSNLAYQSRHGVERCKETEKNEQNISYTYNNCLTDCFNVYSQPKYISSQSDKTAYCEYVTESLSGWKVNSQCSYFSVVNRSLITDIHFHSLDDLDKCNQKCALDCDTINLDIKSMETSCNQRGCYYSWQIPSVRKYVDKSVLLDYYINLPNGSSSSQPIWMKPFMSPSDPTIDDLVNGIAKVFARADVRMEFQINSDISNYTTSQSLEWYSYMGLVGGQINLIVSGSFLTLFQLVWWFSRQIYRNFEKRV